MCTAQQHRVNSLNFNNTLSAVLYIRENKRKFFLEILMFMLLVKQNNFRNQRGRVQNVNKAWTERICVKFLSMLNSNIVNAYRALVNKCTRKPALLLKKPNINLLLN